MIKKFLIFVLILCMLSTAGVVGYFVAPTFSRTMANLGGVFSTLDRGFIKPVNTVLDYFGFTSPFESVTYCYSRSDIDDAPDRYLPDDMPQKYRELFDYCCYAMPVYFGYQDPIDPQYGWFVNNTFYLFFDNIGNFLFAAGSPKSGEYKYQVYYDDTIFAMSYFNPYSNVAGLNCYISSGIGIVLAPFSYTTSFYVEYYQSGCYRAIQDCYGYRSGKF